MGGKHHGNEYRQVLYAISMSPHRTLVKIAALNIVGAKIYELCFTCKNRAPTVYSNGEHKQEYRPHRKKKNH
ncbi:hypothetical protein GCM10027217_24050 [Pseudomaricurvus hydrocarbonicus]